MNPALGVLFGTFIGSDSILSCLWAPLRAGWTHPLHQYSILLKVITTARQTMPFWLVFHFPRDVVLTFPTRDEAPVCTANAETPEELMKQKAPLCPYSFLKVQIRF